MITKIGVRKLLLNKICKPLEDFDCFLDYKKAILMVYNLEKNHKIEKRIRIIKILRFDCENNELISKSEKQETYVYCDKMTIALKDNIYNNFI